MGAEVFPRAAAMNRTRHEPASCTTATHIMYQHRPRSRRMRGGMGIYVEDSLQELGATVPGARGGKLAK